jgi:hypothetical protein
MSYTPVKFKRSEINRAVRGVLDSGHAVDHVTVTADGVIKIYPRARELVPPAPVPAKTIGALKGNQ